MNDSNIRLKGTIKDTVLGQIFTIGLPGYPVIGGLYSTEDILKSPTESINPRYNPEKQRILSQLGKERIKNFVVNYYQPYFPIKTIEIIKRTGGLFCGQPLIRLRFKNRDSALYLSVSLSHNHNRIGVCFMESGLVGIDIQKKSFFLNHLQNIIPKVEADLITKLKDFFIDISYEQIYSFIWTLKESFLKAIGIGFRLGLYSVIISGVDWDNKNIYLSVSQKVVNIIPKRLKEVCFYVYSEKNYFTSIAVLR